jgi:hypothetical protein
MPPDGPLPGCSSHFAETILEWEALNFGPVDRVSAFLAG